MNKHLSLASQTLLTARRSGLRAGQDNTIDILVRVQAPDAAEADAAARPPQAIALVIDRSGSMHGQPLDEARRCAEFVVSRLRPTDTVSVVQFDNRVQRLWPAVPLGDGNAVRGAIGSIHSGGNTNLHGGWLDGADSLAGVPGSALKRVVLLSDGCANEGLTDSAEIAAQCATWAAKGVTTSTYGLGDNFNEDLMVAMARAGGGNHYYGDTAEDLMEPFQQELDLLTNLALRQVELSVSAPDGLRVEMLNELQTVGTGWRLPDLAWGAEAWAILRVTVPAGALPSLGDRMTVLRVSVTGQSLQGEVVALEKAGLALPVLSPSACDALVEDELVQRRSSELAAGLFLTQMRTAASAHDWAAVDGMLADARKRFAGNEWVAGILEAMATLAQSRSRERVMKEAMYSSARLNTRLSAKDEVAYSLVADAGPAYLRRKRQQGKGDV
jgi:Ca-activated chloride channel homolog